MDASPGIEPKNRNFTTFLAKDRETGHKKSTREANAEDLCGNERINRCKSEEAEPNHTGSKESEDGTSKFEGVSPKMRNRTLENSAGVKRNTLQARNGVRGGKVCARS